MPEKRRLSLVILILTVVSALIGIFSSYSQYKTGISEKEKILFFQMYSFSALIDAVARFDQNTFKNKKQATEATLSQLENAFSRKDRTYFDHEIQFVRKTGNYMEIFLRYEGEKKNPIIIAQKEKYVSTPIKKAMDGQTGSGIFLGIYGKPVIAAYTYISVLEIGLIIEVDLRKLQESYWISGINTGVVAIILLGFAAFLVTKLTDPLIHKIREQDMLNAIIVETAYDALLILDENGKIKTMNPAAVQILGFPVEKLINKNMTPVFPPEIKENLPLHDYLAENSQTSLEMSNAVAYREGKISFPAMVAASRKKTNTGLLTVLMVHDLTSLRNAQTAVRNLSQRVLEIQDMERERISRDLHDSLGSQLVALKLQVQHVFAKSSVETKVIPNVLQAFDETIEKVRNISFLLSPFALKHLNLSQALAKLVRKFPAMHSGINLHADIRVSDAINDSTIVMQVYRIIQEAMQNAIKHSEAENIELNAYEDNNRVCISLRDDGTGFKPGTETAHGQGLLIMQERAKLINANIHILSENEKGCEVSLDFEQTI